MKVGDLVKSVGRSHKYGIGIVVKRLSKKHIQLKHTYTCSYIIPSYGKYYKIVGMSKCK